MLQFSATAKANPLNARKQRPENLFSAALEADFNFAEECGEQDTTDESSLFDKVKALFTKHREAGVAKFSEFRQDLEKTMELFVTDAQQLHANLDSMEQNYSQLKQDHDALKQAFDDLKTTLETTPHNHSQRAPATGGENAILTDC